ncbi:MAG: hypothetical protein FJZ01_19810 [Candidatus Sericytochromatia bacterium]|nr:hypothetical protein [Candidatus Tanganyikabacteria bacterium]
MPIFRPGRDGDKPVEPQKFELVPFQEPAKPSRRAFLEREIANFIKSRPEDVAAVIKRWLREDEE